MVRWDGTSGILVQNSDALLDDAGNLTGLTSITVPTIIATNTISTGDNIIRLNDDVVGVPTEDAGIEIERGTSADAQLIWDETLDRWVAGLVGDLRKLVYYTDFANTATVTFDTSGTISASVVADSSTQRVEVAKAATLTSTRKQFNFIDGQGISTTIVDNGGSNRADITIAANLSSTTVDETSSINTSSNSYTTMSSMSITPVAGTYLAWLSVTASNTAGGNGNIRITRGASEQSDSTRNLSAAAAITVALATHAVVTVDGTQTIEGRFNCPSGTFTVTNRALTILRIA